MCTPFLCSKFPCPSKAGSLTCVPPIILIPVPAGVSPSTSASLLESGVRCEMPPTPCWLSCRWQHSYTQRSRHGCDCGQDTAFLLVPIIFPRCAQECVGLGVKLFVFLGVVIRLYIWDVLETNQFLSAPSPSCSWGVPRHHPERARGIMFA